MVAYSGKLVEQMNVRNFVESSKYRLLRELA